MLSGLYASEKDAVRARTVRKGVCECVYEGRNVVVPHVRRRTREEIDIVLTGGYLYRD
jgi:hypothetical protein